jgi:hypothetical protein
MRLAPSGPRLRAFNFVPDKIVEPGNAGIKTQCLRLCVPDTI